MNRFLKTFLMAGILFGASIALAMGLPEFSLREGLMWGMPGGLLFGLAVAIPEALLRKEFEGRYMCDRGETLQREAITRYLGKSSNIFTTATHVGGLYLTNCRVHFKPRKKNRRIHEKIIPLAEILEATPFRPAGLHANGLRIRTAQGDQHFIVDYGANKTWAEAIRRAKAARAA